MANMTIEEIIEDVELICRKKNVGHLYLFGSYATGDHTKTSDIDFVVKDCENITDLRLEVDKIKTLKQIDIIDYDNCKNIYLREDMDKYGKQIY